MGPKPGRGNQGRGNRGRGLKRKIDATIWPSPPSPSSPPRERNVSDDDDDDSDTNQREIDPYGAHKKILGAEHIPSLIYLWNVVLRRIRIW
jgi:hypothetical protein